MVDAGGLVSPFRRPVHRRRAGDRRPSRTDHQPSTTTSSPPPWRSSSTTCWPKSAACIAAGAASRRIARPSARCLAGDAPGRSLLALGFVTEHTAEFSRISMLAWFVVTPVLIVASRIVTRWIQRMLAVAGLQHAEVRHRRRQRVGLSVGAEHRGLARNGTAAGRASSTTGPTSAIPTFPPISAAASGTIHDLVEQARAGHDRPHLHHLSHAGRRAHPRRARPAGRHDGLGLRRARLLRLPIAPFALDRHPRPAGGQRVREPVLRHRRAGQAALRLVLRQPAVAAGRRADGGDRAC